jgi:hypothetical protein
LTFWTFKCYYLITRHLVLPALHFARIYRIQCKLTTTAIKGHQVYFRSSDCARAKPGNGSRHIARPPLQEASQGQGPGSITSNSAPGEESTRQRQRQRPGLQRNKQPPRAFPVPANSKAPTTAAANCLSPPQRFSS